MKLKMFCAAFDYNSNLKLFSKKGIDEEIICQIFCCHLFSCAANEGNMNVHCDQAFLI